VQGFLNPFVPRVVSLLQLQWLGIGDTRKEEAASPDHHVVL
jgi:hypothetical protein